MGEDKPTIIDMMNELQSKYKDNNCCKGVHVFDIRNKKALTLTTNHLVLATGGVGQAAYERQSYPFDYSNNSG